MLSLRNIPCPTYSSEPSTGGRARNFARSRTPPWRRAKMQDQCVISEIGAQPGLMRRSKERYLSDLSEREQRNGGLGQSWGPQQHLLPQPLPS
jgi:hypothetical protein